MKKDEWKSLPFEEKELSILRNAVDKMEKQSGKKLVQSDEIVNIIKIVEDFIHKKKLICYGGTAINNILPEKDQFYDKDAELPDYDFFSTRALDHAKQLADIYVSEGYEDVEAKAGVHHGTFKVFVNYIPVADVTQLSPEIFKVMSKTAIKKNGIAYAPPNYLRMSMFLELSRPQGDVSRWEKVLKRLTLLNKNYPMKNPRCNQTNFMRSFEEEDKDINVKNKALKIYGIIRNTLINEEVIFFGGYATSLYGRHMTSEQKKKLKKTPDFDVLSENHHKTAQKLQKVLELNGFDNVKIHKRKAIGELVSDHYEVAVGEETVCFIYKPNACHGYNTIKIKGKTIKVATIDTMLNFYLAFIYADRLYYDHDRIICMAQYLFSVQNRNRLRQNGLLKRFNTDCYGTQLTLVDMRNEKNKKFEELKKDKNSKKYEEYFLRYTPTNKNIKVKNTSKSKKVSKVKKVTKTKKVNKGNKKQNTKKNYKNIKRLIPFFR